MLPDWYFDILVLVSDMLGPFPVCGLYIRWSYRCWSINWWLGT